MESLKSWKWLILISGIFIVVLGFIMLFTPRANLIGIALFIGLVMLLSGISEIITFFSEKGHRSGWLLACGILSVLFGVWIFFGRGVEVLKLFMPFMFAAWIMTTGIIRIVGATSTVSEVFHYRGWMLAFGILGTILGFMLLFNPLLSAFVLAYTFAFMFIFYGIDSIILFMHLKRKHKQIEA